jgi:HemY protein
MKRSVIILLILVVAAGYLGTLIARDPGYVLVTYDGFSMQTSLWILLGLMALLIGAVYLTLRGLGVIRKSPLIYSSWQAERREKRATELTAKGLSLLAEGEATRARKYLESGANYSSQVGINYLAAAIAANAVGDHEAREAFLRQAEEADAGLSKARIVVSAELALQRGDAQAALTMLKNVKNNAHILSLREKALRMGGNWREALMQLPEFRSGDKTRALVLEKDMALAGLLAEAGSDESVNALFRGLSGEARQNPEVVEAYVLALSERDPAEPVLRSLLKKNWCGSLVRLYGDLGTGSLNTRRKTAESWLRKHDNDADLHFCLGCIYEAAGAPGLARESLAQSLELDDTPQVRERLGLLLMKEGQYDRSQEYLLSARAH